MKKRVFRDGMETKSKHSHIRSYFLTTFNYIIFFINNQEMD